MIKKISKISDIYGKGVLFETPLEVDITEDGYGKYLYCKDFDIHSFCYKEQSIEEAFCGDVVFYHQEYSSKDDSSLDETTLRIKKNLLERVEFIHPDKDEYTFEDFLHPGEEDIDE